MAMGTTTPRVNSFLGPNGEMRFFFQARLPDSRDFPLPVHDGDTLWLEIDRGFRDSKNVNGRLEEVRAPELKQVGGLQTQRYVVDWLIKHGSGKWPYLLETIRVQDETHEKTSFDRYIVQVTDKSTGESLNTAVMLYVSNEGYPTGS